MNFVFPCKTISDVKIIKTILGFFRKSPLFSSYFRNHKYKSLLTLWRIIAGWVDPVVLIGVFEAPLPPILCVVV